MSEIIPQIPFVETPKAGFSFFVSSRTENRVWLAGNITRVSPRGLEYISRELAYIRKHLAVSVGRPGDDLIGPYRQFDNRMSCVWVASDIERKALINTIRQILNIRTM